MCGANQERESTRAALIFGSHFISRVDHVQYAQFREQIGACLEAKGEGLCRMLFEALSASS
jgi:hypothetical protein